MKIPESVSAHGKIFSPRADGRPAENRLTNADVKSDTRKRCRLQENNACWFSLAVKLENVSERRKGKFQNHRSQFFFKNRSAEEAKFMFMSVTSDRSTSDPRNPRPVNRDSRLVPSLA